MTAQTARIAKSIESLQKPPIGGKQVNYDHTKPLSKRPRAGHNRFSLYSLNNPAMLLNPDQIVGGPLKATLRTAFDRRTSPHETGQV